MSTGHGPDGHRYSKDQAKFVVDQPLPRENYRCHSLDSKQKDQDVSDPLQFDGYVVPLTIFWVSSEKGKDRHRYHRCRNDDLDRFIRDPPE